MSETKEKNPDQEKLINFRTSTELRDRMKVAAKKDNRSLAMWLRNIIEKALKESEGN